MEEKKKKKHCDLNMKGLSGKRVSYQSQKFCKNKNKNKQKGPTFKKGRCL